MILTFIHPDVESKKTTIEQFDLTLEVTNSNSNIHLFSPSSKFEYSRSHPYPTATFCKQGNELKKLATRAWLREKSASMRCALARKLYASLNIFVWNRLYS